jgi:hypothetical protein
MVRGSLQWSGLPSILRITAATPIPAAPARRAVMTALGGTAARPGPSHNRASWVPGPLKTWARQLAHIPEATRLHLVLWPGSGPGMLR